MSISSRIKKFWYNHILEYKVEIIELYMDDTELTIKTEYIKCDYIYINFKMI